MKQALEKREVLHKNSMPRIFIYKRYYRKNSNPTLTFRDKQLLNEFDEYGINMVNLFLLEEAITETIYTFRGQDTKN